MRSTDLIAKLRLDSTPFDQSLKSAQAQLQNVSRVAGAVPGRNILGTMAADAANLVPALSSVPLGIAAVGAAMATAGTAARRAGVEFEASLAKIATLGPGAKAALDETRSAILDTFTSVPVTGAVTDLAEANYLLQSSGRSAEDAITDLRTAAEASVAGYTDVTVAVDGLTSVTGAWAESAISTARASDVLFAAVNVGKSSFQDIAQSLGLVAPLAASAGVRFEEVAAAVAVLSNQGLKTSSIMEGLRSAILNIQKPTEAFRREYADLAREFGAGRLAQDGLIKFLQDFEKASGGSRNALNALFSDATGLTTALGLLKNGGLDASAALRSMEGSAGATAAALAEVNGTAKAQEQLVRNQLKATWTDFGSLLSQTTLPVLEAIGRALNTVQGKAGFVKTDLARFLSSGDLQQAGKDLQALVDLYTQFEAAPDDFLASASSTQLADLRYQLLQRKPEPFSARERARQGLLERIPQELTRRADTEKEERDATAAGEARATKKAELLAADQTERDLRERRRLRLEEEKRDRDRLAKDAVDEQQRAVKTAAQFIEQLDDKAAAVTLGAAEALQRAMMQTLEEGAAQLRSGLLSPEDEAKLKARLITFYDLEQQLVAATRAADTTKAAIDSALDQEQMPALQVLAARERELVLLREGMSNSLARKKVEEQLLALAKARGDITGETFGVPTDSLQRQIAMMGDLAQSLATVGDQLGLLPRRAVDALRGIGALAEQGTALQKAFSAGSGISTLGKISIGIGVAGGIASLAASLLGDSPAEQARKQVMRDNTEALRRLTQNVGDLANTTVSGGSFARVGAFTASLLSVANEVTAGDPRLQDRLRMTRAGYVDRGTTRDEVIAVAEALGVTLDNTVGSFRRLQEALREADFNAYSKTFAGSMQRLSDSITADGVTDPIELLQRRIAVLTNATTGFPALAQALAGVDVSTADGRGTALDRVRSLFGQVQAGTLGASQYGELSLGDARTQLLELISSLRDSSAGTGTGGFNETRTVTEVTGNRLAGLFSSANQYLRDIAADVSVMRQAFVIPAPVRIAPPSLASLVGRSGDGSISFGPGAITVNVTLPATLLGDGAGRAVDVAQEFGTVISERVIAAIDDALGERALRRRLLRGDARL